MKVLFLFSGIPHYLNALLNKISAKGIDISVVVPATKSSALGKGVKTIEKKSDNYKYIETEEKTSLIGKKYFPNLDKIINDEKPDILVAGWPYFLAIAMQPKLRKAIKDNSVKFVMREIPFQTPPYKKIREYFSDNPMYDEDMNLMSRGLPFYIRQFLVMKLRRYCYQKADGALLYSSVGRNIITSYGIDNERVFVTFNSGDTDALIEEKQKIQDLSHILPTNSKRIIHIGRLVKWKRVDLLIDAFALVVGKHNNAELIILGDGPERKNLEQQANDLGIDENIKFVGAIYNPIEIGRYMDVSSVYVLAGMGGLSINDAMTYGLPVICSVCDGTEKDLIENEVNGLFFEENNKDDLVEKILTLVENNDLRTKMGLASEKTISSKINLDSVSDRYIDSFKKIISF